MALSVIIKLASQALVNSARFMPKDDRARLQRAVINSVTSNCIQRNIRLYWIVVHGTSARMQGAILVENPGGKSS